MRSLITIIIFFVSGLAFSADIRVEISTQKPAVGESFYLDFIISADSENEPYISFSSGGAEVLGKRYHGQSISSTIINGRISVRRERTIRYELVANRPGKLRLTNIKIDLGGVVQKVNNVNLLVLSKPVESPKIFVLAIPTKKTVYLGEGFNVHYYLYYRVPVGAQELQQFPKLNGFIKRFHMPNVTPERATYDGKVYTRSLKYTARVYPQKVGTLKIDTLRMNVHWSSGRGNPFSLFGMGNRLRKSNVGSEPIKIEVLPLPTEGLPSHFTGLVGEHKFTLENSREKHLVNEAIETRLIVEGPGALEKFEAPVLYRHKELEQFDTNTSFEEIGRLEARKTFDYTYLGRGQVEIEKRSLKLSWFDPSTRSYKTSEVLIPPLSVSGVGSQTRVSSGPVIISTKESKNETAEKKYTSLLAPIFKPMIFDNISLEQVFNILMILINLILLVLILPFKFGSGQRERTFIAACRELRSGMPTYSNVHKILAHLTEGPIGSKGNTMGELIDTSHMSEEAKTYFRELVRQGERTSYDMGGRKETFVYKNDYFKELLKDVKRRAENSART